MSKYYEAYEKRYRQVHQESLAWASDKNSPIVMEMLKKYIDCENPRLLEVGCGEGRDALHLLKLGCDVQALDISEEAIRYCRERAGEENRERFHVVDVCTEAFEGQYDFIYSVATLHMLVLQPDRQRYLSFIRRRLSDKGYALILTMGDGVMERESDIGEAFTNQKRSHWETGRELEIAATSCKMVCFETFRKELSESGFLIVEDGLTCIEPDFPTIMYAVVRQRP